MKSEKGITLISVTIYVIVITVVIGVLAIITTFFYKNTTDIYDINPLTEYTRFNSYFTEEINREDIRVLECGTLEEGNCNYIVFNNGVQYTFVPENKGIYRNKVKICNNITNCSFEKGTNSNGRTTVMVNIKAENDDTNKQPITYTLKKY